MTCLGSHTRDWKRMSALQTSKLFSPKLRVTWILTLERSKMDGLVTSAGIPFIALWIIVFIITLQGWGSFWACIILPGWHLNSSHSYCSVYSMLYSLTRNWCIYTGTPRPTSQYINAPVRSKVYSCMTVQFLLAMKNPGSSKPIFYIVNLYLITALNLDRQPLMVLWFLASPVSQNQVLLITLLSWLFRKMNWVT